MNESLAVLTPFDDQQHRAIEMIGNRALRVVASEFGSGYPFYRGGHNGGLAYHNAHHARQVKTGGAIMAEALGLSSSAAAVVRAAALAHDIVQLKPRGIMERESAEWLKNEVARRRILPAATGEIGALCILGTELIVEHGRVVGQMVSRLEYASKAAEAAAHSVAAGDFYHLYSPGALRMAHDIYLEMNDLPPDSKPPLDEAFVRFQRYSAAFSDEFTFAHPAAKQLFGGLRANVVTRASWIADEVERGNIEDWDQLLAEDEAFRRAHS